MASHAFVGWRVVVNDVDVSHMVLSVNVDASVGQLSTTTVVFMAPPSIYREDDGCQVICLGGTPHQPPTGERQLRLRESPHE